MSAPEQQADSGVRGTIRLAMIRNGQCAPDAATNLLDIYRDEVRNAAAAEQRAALLDEGYDLSCRCDSCTACLVRYAISAIDPGTDYYEDTE